MREVLRLGMAIWPVNLIPTRSEALPGWPDTASGQVRHRPSDGPGQSQD
jgi:hypothetical protein